MPASPSKIFSSAAVITSIRRQRGQGLPALQNMYKFLGMQVSPKHTFNMSELGIEVGSGTISQQRAQKENFAPEISYSGHLRMGAALNLLAASGYGPVFVGNAAPATPVNTTLSAALTARHGKVIPLTSITGFAVGDWLQIGSLIGATPTQLDTVMVHEIASLGATNFVQTLYLNATAGTFRLSYNGQTTAALTFSGITASTIQTALTGLSSIGTGNLTVAAGTATSNTIAFTITGAGTLAATNIELITADGSLLTSTPTGPFAVVVETTPGCGASQAALVGRTLYTYPTATAVSKVDRTKGCQAYFTHIQPDSALEGDLYSTYFRMANPDGVVVDGLLYDGAGASYSPSFSTGQIATVASDLKFLNVTRDFGRMFAIQNSLLSDPSSVTINNTRGSFTILGQSVDGPKSVSMTISSEIYDDVVLTQLIKQSNVHIGHTVSATAEGKFLKSYFDTIIYGSGTATSVTDAIPEAAFNYLAQSATLVATGIPYAFGIYAPACQLAQYDPTVSTNQPVTGNIGMVKIVPDSTTGKDTWYYTATVSMSGDVLCAA